MIRSGIFIGKTKSGVLETEKDEIIERYVVPSATSTKTFKGLEVEAGDVLELFYNINCTPNIDVAATDLSLTSAAYGHHTIRTYYSGNSQSTTTSTYGTLARVGDGDYACGKATIFYDQGGYFKALGTTVKRSGSSIEKDTVAITSDGTLSALVQFSIAIPNNGLGEGSVITLKRNPMQKDR